MKNKSTFKQKIKTCFNLLFTDNNSLAYVIDLEERCKKVNFAPFSLSMSEKYPYFVWNEETIQIAENWLKEHHTN